MSVENVLFIESNIFDQFPNVFNRIHQSGYITKGCFERECILGVYIDYNISKNASMRDINASLYRDIEGFMFIERSKDHVEFHSLYVFPTSDSNKIITDLIIRSQAYITKFKRICAIIDLANSNLQPIVKIYADLGFKSPCIYVKCNITNIPYPYPFIGLLYDGSATTSVADIIRKSKKLIDNFNNPDEIIKIGGDKIDDIPKKCLEGYLLKKFIFEGAYGVVYQSCDITNDCRYAMKMQEIADEEAARDWRREINHMKILSENYNIGPKFIGAWTCNADNIGMTVTELWDGVLKAKECPPINIRNKIKDQISKLHDLGLIHGDILEKNILVRRDKNDDVVDATLTDFGFLTDPDEWKNNIDFLHNVYNYHMKYPSTKLYYLTENLDFDDIYDDPYHLDQGLIYFWNEKC